MELLNKLSAYNKLIALLVVVIAWAVLESFGVEVSRLVKDGSALLSVYAIPAPGYNASSE